MNESYSTLKLYSQRIATQRNLGRFHYKYSMRNQELINRLQQLPREDEVWLPVYNGHVVTYGVIDDVCQHHYQSISNDFFGTPGRMDKRLFDNHRHASDEETVIMLSSEFSEYPNSAVDIGDDDIDYDIDTINGEEGDPDLVWKLNDFIYDEDANVWHREAIGDCSAILWCVQYNPEQHVLKADNYQNDMHFSGRVFGIETLRNIIKLLNIDLQIWT